MFSSCCCARPLTRGFVVFKPKHRPFLAEPVCDWPIELLGCLTWTNEINPHPRTTKSTATFSRKDLALFRWLPLKLPHDKTAKKTLIMTRTSDISESVLTQSRRGYAKRNNTHLRLRLFYLMNESDRSCAAVDTTGVLS